MVNLLVNALLAILAVGLVYLVAGLLLPHPWPLIFSLVVGICAIVVLLRGKSPIV